MLISDFFNSFHYYLYSISPDEIRMDVNKHERIVKHTLFTVIGGKREVPTDQIYKMQEMVHVKIDQLAQDYRTWQRNGYKRYAKPKQYITGRVAAAAKRAFDQTLHNLIVNLRKTQEVDQVRPRRTLVMTQEEREERELDQF